MRCISKFEDVEEIKFEGSTLINKGYDFRLGFWDGIELNDRNQLVLKHNMIQGSYVSPKVTTNKFKDLVASWNVETPEGTEIEVFVKVKKANKWSKWFSYGKWSQNGTRGSINGQRDEIAIMDIDTITILDGKEADGFKSKIIISRDDFNTESPKVKAISATLRLSKTSLFQLEATKNWLVELDVPERSQMVVPEIGNIICSPTSLSMVMEYYGVKIDTEEVAAKVKDSGAEIYGNWSYNVAYAGAIGFDSYVARLSSIEEIKDKISAGIPIVASIRNKDKEELTGAPMGYPSGHLIVVRGFEIINGVEYIIVNDPAAPNYDTVRREYILSEFEKAWGRIVYILTLNSANR